MTNTYGRETFHRRKISHKNLRVYIKRSDNHQTDVGKQSVRMKDINSQSLQGKVVTYEIKK